MSENKLPEQQLPASDTLLDVRHLKQYFDINMGFFSSKPEKQVVVEVKDRKFGGLFIFPSHQGGAISFIFSDVSGNQPTRCPHASEKSV